MNKTEAKRKVVPNKGIPVHAAPPQADRITGDRYLVVGIDLGSGQRYADYFFSAGPDEAKELAHQEVEETGGGLLVAAVILGDRIVA